MLDTRRNNRVELSIIIPAHNSSHVLAQTVRSLESVLPGSRAELIIVENGSTDDTFEIARELERNAGPLSIRLLRSEPGIGHALTVGISQSIGRVIYITGDDLPFGTADLFDGMAVLQFYPVVIGSKAHEKSVVKRGPKRALSTNAFKFLRKLALGSVVGDSQGTFIVDGDWLRKVVPLINQGGFLFTTSIVECAELCNKEILEIPVQLSENHATKQSSVRFKHILEMTIGLIKLRANRKHLRAQLDSLTSE